ncbi:hypothetical protein Hdeb2414_s0009g00315381 [Helianthus debilis subsp. tardiflorus]
MLKRTDEVNRPGIGSGSRPDRSYRPARSGFQNIDFTIQLHNIPLHMSFVLKTP